MKKTIESLTPPSNKQVMWLDISSEVKQLKAYINGKWVVVNDDTKNNEEIVKKVLEKVDSTYYNALKTRPKGTFLAAPSNKDGKADFRSIAFEDLPDSIKDTVLDNMSYGVSWKPNVADPVLTRVGNMNYHKTLPIQSEMKGCILNPKTKEVVYWLDESNWTYKKGGNPNKGETEDLARLDGYDGEVFVYVPEFWIKSWDTDTRREVRISPTKIDDSWEHQPAIFVSAYKNTVLTTVPKNMGYLSTLKINSAISVANNATYCRGGDTNTTYDTHKDIFKGTLGKPRTAINRPTFRGYARQAGKEIMSYKQYKNIMYWLYVIEYANFNSQAEFNSELTSEGFHQGGLGNGITNVSKHYDYNYNNPICINGYTNQFGNGTNIKVIESTYLAPVNNVYAIRWRGIENPFGDTSTIVDGVLVDNSFSHDVHVYVTDDPNKYGDTAQSRNNMILLRTTKLRNTAFIKEFNLGTTAEIILRSFGGDATSYKCDYFDSTSFGSDTCLLVWQGSSGGGGLCGGSLMTNADDAYVDQSYRTVIIA